MLGAYTKTIIKVKGPRKEKENIGFLSALSHLVMMQVVKI